VRGVLAPQVQTLDGALAATVAQIHAYDAFFTAGTQLATVDLQPLIAQTVAVLTQQYVLCTGLSHRVVVPSSDPGEAAQRAEWAALREDLVLFSAQIAVAMQETSTDVARMPRNLESPRANAYAARIGAALPILRQAEAWLETIDQQTGAHATLPGFAPGAPSLESVLGLQ
jgi:hypothetical protein